MTMEQQIKANKIAKVRRYCTEPAKYKDGRLKRDYDAIKAHDYLKETLEQIRAYYERMKDGEIFDRPTPAYMNS